MKLQEKHVVFLDKIPVNEWVREYDLPSMGNGITKSTLQALSGMGIIDMAIIDVSDALVTDQDVERGYIKVRVKRDKGWGYACIKKLVSDYRTRDYEILALKKQVESLTEKIKQLEETGETDIYTSEEMT